MNQLDCPVIRDLLPLYADRACCPETAALVEAHLRDCPACRQLCAEMTAQLPAAEGQALAFDEKPRFRRACRTILAIIAAAAVMISCFFANVGGAWMGGPASVGNLIATLLYTAFWGVFTVLVRHYGPLVKVSFVVSLLTVISAANSLVFRLLGGGGFIAALSSVFASVPMYGLRVCLDWTGVYAAATALALVWLLYSGHNLRRLGRSLR